MNNIGLTCTIQCFDYFIILSEKCTLTKDLAVLGVVRDTKSGKNFSNNSRKSARYSSNFFKFLFVAFQSISSP